MTRLTGVQSLLSEAGRRPGLTAAAIGGGFDLAPGLVARTLAPVTGRTYRPAMREAARLGLGVSLIAQFDVQRDLERGDLIRLLPDRNPRRDFDKWREGRGSKNVQEI